MTLGNRLKAARKHAKISQKELEQAAGVPQQTISNIERGIQDKSTDIVPLALACGVRPEWLALGNEPMIQESIPEQLQTIKKMILEQETAQYEAKAWPFSSEMLDKFKLLDPEHQSEIQSFVVKQLDLYLSLPRRRKGPSP